MNTKSHAVTDIKGRPIQFIITAGQISDYTGAAALLDDLPVADWLLADRGYDADWFREALINKGMKPCLPGRKSRKKAIKYDKRRYKRRNSIERMFVKLKDWRRVSTRYDRCPNVLMSAIALASAILFWLRVLSNANYYKRSKIVFWAYLGGDGRQFFYRPAARLFNSADAKWLRTYHFEKASISERGPSNCREPFSHACPSGI